MIAADVQVALAGLLSDVFSTFVAVVLAVAVYKGVVAWLTLRAME